MDEKSNGIEGFTFFRSYYEALNELDSKDASSLMLAIVAYVFEDKEPTFKNKVLMSNWKLLKPHLDTSKKRSIAKSKRNQNGTK